MTGVRLALLAGVLATASPARADGDRDLAKRLKDEAAAALEEGRNEVAVAKLLEAYRAYPSPNLRFNLGVALERVGRRVEAAVELEAFLADAPDAPAAARQRALALLADLDRRLGRLAITGPPGAAVTLDGTAAGRLPLPRAPRIAPGRHQVSAAGAVPAVADVEIAAGEVKAVAFDPAPARPPAPAPLRRPAAWPFVVGVAALAALGVGAGLWASAAVDYDALAGSCAPFCARDQWASLPPREYAGVALVAVGAAAVALDVVLWLSRGRSDGSRRSWRSPSGVGVSAAVLSW